VEDAVTLIDFASFIKIGRSLMYSRFPGSFFPLTTTCFPLLRRALAVYRFITTESPSRVTRAEVTSIRLPKLLNLEKPAAPQHSLMVLIPSYPMAQYKALSPAKTVCIGAIREKSFFF